MKIISLNVNGIRAATQKGCIEWLRRQKADVICLQEVRADEDQLPRKVLRPRGYYAAFHPAQKRGYSGVAIYAKAEPKRFVHKLAWPEWDTEGRFLEADFGHLSVISIYLPSGSSGPTRQAHKFKVMKRLMRMLKKMRQDGREYILCGDWNIAHKNIDLKNWRSNQKNSGFLPEERAWMDTLFGPVGFVDAFRLVDPNPDRYTWWSNRGQAWAKNVGWRIDYQIITPGLASRVRSASIYTRRRFSDHAPLIIEYDHVL